MLAESAKGKMPTSSFESQFRAVFQEFRGSVTELLLSVAADIDRPQNISRKLRIDKNLSWKTARLVNSTDAYAAVQHMPGAAGLEILLRAVEKAGATKMAIERTRAAYRAFDETIEHHLGDRSTFELVVDGLAPGPDGERLELSRRLAFRGNSGIWGVQAGVRVNTAFVAPSRDDPLSVDTALVGGWIDFRRLRQEARWPLFRARTYSDDGSDAGTPVAIEPDGDSAGGPMLMRRFCTARMPEIQASRESDGTTVYELGDGPIGNTGAFTCFYGSLTPRLGPRYRDETNHLGEFFAMVSAPAETLLFDLLIHHEIAAALQPTVDVYRVLTADPRSRVARDRLPISEKYQHIGDRPPVVATPLVPRYAELVNTVYQRAGWDPNDFCGVRFVLKYPPFPSTVVFGFPLPEQP